MVEFWDEPAFFRVKGITFTKPPLSIWNKIKPGSRVSLEREPTNMHDRHAVRVVFDGLFIGYCQKELSEYISAEVLKHGCIGVVAHKHSTPDDRPSLIVIPLYEHLCPFCGNKTYLKKEMRMVDLPDDASDGQCSDYIACEMSPGLNPDWYGLIFHGVCDSCGKFVEEWV